METQEYNLRDMTEVENSKPQAYELPFNKILTNTQMMWFDLMTNGFGNFETNYYFYIAITFIFIFVLYLSFLFIFD